MSSIFIRALCLFAMFSILGASAGTKPKKVQEKNKPITLRWEIVHLPFDYFVQMAKIFKEKVEKETNKRVVVDIVVNKSHRLKTLTAEQATNEAYLEHKLVASLREKGVKELQEGKTDIAQGYSFYLASVANPEYHALELPYVFEDYDHINSFLESEAGEALLASTVAKHNMRGLAYSFSGGLLVVLTQKSTPLVTKENWAGKRFRNVESMIRQRAIKELGGNFVSLDFKNEKNGKSNFRKSSTNAILKKDLIDAEEVHLPDLQRKLMGQDGAVMPYALKRFSVSETQHTLLSTIFLISEKKFQSMSSEDQKVVKSAALFAARFERALTVRRYEEAKKRLTKAGIDWRTVPASERTKIRNATEAVYTQLYKEVPTTKTIVDKINEWKNMTPEKVAGQ